MDNYVYVSIVVVLTIILICRALQRESFATKCDKASAIYDWFARTPNPTYNDYQRYMGNQSDIVEYEVGRRAIRQRSRSISLKTIEAGI